MAGLRLDTLAVTKRLTAAGMDSRQAGELAEALTEQAIELYMTIKDVEIRLAWLRVYGIWAAGTFFLVLIDVVQKLSR